jgi:hypothetical protein
MMEHTAVSGGSQGSDAATTLAAIAKRDRDRQTYSADQKRRRQAKNARNHVWGFGTMRKSDRHA